MALYRLLAGRSAVRILRAMRWSSGFRHCCILPLTVFAVFAAGFAVRAQTPPIPNQGSPAFVVGYMQSRPDKADEAARALSVYARESRREAGAEDLRVLQEVGRGTYFLVLERWADADRQAAHDQGSARLKLTRTMDAIGLAPADFRSHQAFLGDELPAPPSAKAVYVMSHLDVAPPAFPALEDAVVPYFRDQRSWTGAAGFQVLQYLAPRKNHLTTLELWDSQAALNAHRAGAAAIRFRKALGPILGALYDERLYLSLN